LFIFQVIQRQCGLASRVAATPGTATVVDTPVSIMNLGMTRQIREKLPVQCREDFIELEEWLQHGNDEELNVKRTQLIDYMIRGTFGTTEKDFVQTAFLTLFTKRFASAHMSWAGAKNNKEFTLRKCYIWELLNYVICDKYPN
jgi:hypothetical protein